LSRAFSRSASNTPIAEVSRKGAIAARTLYRWKKKFEKMAPSEIEKLGQLEGENRRLCTAQDEMIPGPGYPPAR
jgi:transposase-like protein